MGGIEYHGFREAVIMTVDKLRVAYPLARIILTTMNHFKRGSSGAFPIHNGLHSLPEYNNAIREVADFMGVDVIELDKDGITFQNTSDESPYFPAGDLTHPNGEGHLMIAKKAIKDFVAKY